MRTSLTLLFAMFVLSSLSFAGDWPAFRGPDHTGVSKETGLLKTWPSDGPKLLWQSDKAGLGYAGLAVVGGTVYTMGCRGEDEYLIALDEKGKEKWAAKIGPTFDWDANSWSKGPNATPTVDGDLIFALSSRGMLLAANKSNGKEVWKLDLVKQLGGEVNDIGGGYEGLGWGYSWSPVVDGDTLVLLPGGSKGLFAAVDKKTGKVKWQSKEIAEAATYGSPTVATIGGTKQYLAVTQKTLVGVAASDGSVLWKHTREEDYPDIVCATPIVQDNIVYLSVGKLGGSEAFQVSGSGGKFRVETAWSNKLLCNYHSGVVKVGEYVYGYHEDRHWACQNFATGELAWPKGRTRQAIKAGGFVAADGRLYVLDDQGVLAMLEASPTAFKVVSQYKLPDSMRSKQRKSAGGIWTYPSLSDGKLYIRDQELVFCFQVK